MLVDLRRQQPQNQIRVVFDTNAFAENTFGLLANGPMQSLYRQGWVMAVYGHVFLEETLRVYGLEAKRTALVKSWLPFIFATTDRLCNDFNTIWRQELVCGLRARAKIYIPRSDNERLVESTRHIPLDGSWHAWEKTKAQRDEEDRKRAAQLDLLKDMRKSIESWKKTIGYKPVKHGTPPNIDQFFRREVEGLGRALIRTVVPCEKPASVRNRWASDMDNHPFFTTCVVNLLYMAHYAMTKSDKALDRNAKADLFLMTHLLHSDVLVSNEKGFLRQAFEDLAALGKGGDDVK
jgi:hypothetical protein